MILHIFYAIVVMSIMYSFIIIVINIRKYIINSNLFTIYFKKYFKYIKNNINYQSNQLTYRVNNLKNQFGVKSTENTFTNVAYKYIVNKPKYFKTNKIYNKKFNLNKYNDKLYFLLTKNNNNNNNNDNKNIIKSYILNKIFFNNLFIHDDKSYKIKNLKSFEMFYKNVSANVKIQKNFKIQKNLLLKFYNPTNNPTNNDYTYIYANNNNLIKIINNEEYDKITYFIETNNNIFLIFEKPNKYHITHGGYIQCNLSEKNVKKIFFNDLKKCKLNKNFNFLNKFKNLKIFFYVSTQIE